MKGLAISICGFCIAASWQKSNRFVFAYVSGSRGFGWHEHTGFCRWNLKGV